MLEDGLAVASQQDDAAELAAGGAVVEPGGERGQLDAHARAAAGAGAREMTPISGG